MKPSVAEAVRHEFQDIRADLLVRDFEAGAFFDYLQTGDIGCVGRLFPSRTGEHLDIALDEAAVGALCRMGLFAEVQSYVRARTRGTKPLEPRYSRRFFRGLLHRGDGASLRWYDEQVDRVSVGGAGGPGAFILYLAAVLDNVPAGEYLQSRGIPLNVRLPVAPHTPLALAAALHGNERFLLFLLENSPGLFAVCDDEGRYPLPAAAGSCPARTVETLLDRGAPDFPDRWGHRAMHQAAWSGRTANIDLLAGRGRSVDAVVNGGKTPLLLAARNGHAPVMEALLARGANPGARDFSGRDAFLSALAGALTHSVIEPTAWRDSRTFRGMAQALEAMGLLDAQSRDYRGRNALSLALDLGADEAWIEMLHELGVPLQETLPDGRTAARRFSRRRLGRCHSALRDRERSRSAMEPGNDGGADDGPFL